MKKRWGWFITLLRGKQFKVKLLYFNAGKSISYQQHNHRRELWLFIFGEGLMKICDNTQIATRSGISELIDKNQWHQYTAETDTLVLEIQFGGHCSERDIVRV